MPVFGVKRWQPYDPHNVFHPNIHVREEVRIVVTKCWCLWGRVVEGTVEHVPPQDRVTEAVIHTGERGRVVSVKRY